MVKQADRAGSNADESSDSADCRRRSAADNRAG